MNLFTFKKLRTRFLVWFILLLVVPLFSVLTITYYWQTAMIKNQASEKLIAIRDLKVNRLKGWLREREGDMRIMSNDNELKDLEYLAQRTRLTQNDKIILNNCRQILNRYVKNFPVYEELFVINPEDGKVLISTQKEREGEDNGKSEFFTDAMQSRKLVFNSIYNSKTLSDNEMAFSIPIFCSQHTGKHIVGILVAHINFKKSLYKLLLNRVGLGKTGETLIVNKDVVALNELRWYDNSLLNLQISAKPALNAAAGKTGIAVTADYRNKQVLAAYTYIPETKWGFICKQDIDELNAPINRMLLNFILLFFAIITLAFFVSFIISNSISKPIVSLNRIARKIKAGNLSARITIKSDDEVGELSQSFNTMAEAIELRAKTQKKVGEILETIIKQTSLPGFGFSLLKQMMKATGANIGVFYNLNEATAEYEPVASFGASTEMLETINSNTADSEFKNTLAKKSIYFFDSVPEDIVLRYKLIANGTIPKEIITIPIMVDGSVAALVTLVSVNKFKRGAKEVVKLSWQSVNISYSNLLSGDKTRNLADRLVRTNEELTVKSIRLQQRTEELKSAISSLESFAYSVSHDLKAPLRSISQLSYWIYEDYKDILGGDGKEQLNLLIGRVKRMDALIEGILQYSRIGRVHEAENLINLNTLVEEVIDSLAVPENMEINIVNVLPEYYGDETRFIQVFQNLINNSMQFSDKPKGKISIACSDEGSNWRFSIIDNGPGIEKKYHKKVFRIFETLNTRDTHESTGLGLALVKKIIDFYKGIIWIESTLGEGTKVFFTLPKKKIKKKKINKLKQVY